MNTLTKKAKTNPADGVYTGNIYRFKKIIPDISTDKFPYFTNNITVKSNKGELNNESNRNCSKNRRSWPRSYSEGNKKNTES